MKTHGGDPQAMSEHSNPTVVRTAVRRREVLAALGILAAALAAPGSGSRILSTSVTDIQRFAYQFASLLGFEPADARSFVASDAALDLMRGILGLDLARPETLAMSAGQLKQRINEQMKADYSRGAVVNVCGWWLSRTETHCLEFVAALNGRPQFTDYGAG